MKASSILIILFILGASSCKHDNHNYARVEGAMLGTTLCIIADIDAPPQELYATAMRLDKEFKAEMSLFDPNSHLSRINRGESDSLSPGIIYNLRLSDSVSRISGGAYDVTVAPLVKALGFGAQEERQERPNIDSILKFVGYEKLSIDGDRLLREDPRTQIDFNSIAKGYIVDRIAEVTASMGATNYFVEIGGEIFCQGVNPYGEPWRIGVESPFDGNMSSGDHLQKRIAIPADSPMRAVATSGNYRRFYLDENGNKVAHTIDPITGQSKLSSLLSVTVVAPTCALADAYSTMLMALGATKAVEMAQQLTDAEVYFIFADHENNKYKEYISVGMKELIME